MSIGPSFFIPIRSWFCSCEIRWEERTLILQWGHFVLSWGSLPWVLICTVSPEFPPFRMQERASIGKLFQYISKNPTTMLKFDDWRRTRSLAFWLSAPSFLSPSSRPHNIPTCASAIWDILDWLVKLVHKLVLQNQKANKKSLQDRLQTNSIDFSSQSDDFWCLQKFHCDFVARMNLPCQIFFLRKALGFVESKILRSYSGEPEIDLVQTKWTEFV